MRLLHSVAPADVGGLEEVVIRLARGLADRHHDVHVAVTASVSPASHRFVADLEAVGVTVHHLMGSQRAYLTEASRIREAVGRLEPHVLHTHGYRPGILHAWAVGALRTPLVTTLHGFTGGGLKIRCYEWIQLRAARRYDAVVAVSRAMTPRLRGAGVPSRRIHVVPNAWEPRHELHDAAQARLALGVQSDRFHIGWVGRLSAEKGPDVFIEACARLLESDFTASVVGTGPLEADLRARAGRHRSIDIRFHGSIPSAARLLPAFDVLVLSSRTEGTPIVLFEAMEAGVPVVATRVGGVPDVLDDTTAILVPPEDPVALAKAITTVRGHPQAARKRATRARERLREEFALGPWIDRYEAIYASVCDRA